MENKIRLILDLVLYPCGRSNIWKQTLKQISFYFPYSYFEHWLYSFLHVPFPGSDCILGSHGVAAWVESWTGEDVGAFKGGQGGQGVKGGQQGGGSCQNTASTAHPCVPGDHRLPIHKAYHWTACHMSAMSHNDQIIRSASLLMLILLRQWRFRASNTVLQKASHQVP